MINLDKQSYHFDDNSLIWWNLNSLIKIHHLMKIKHFDENSLLWWKIGNVMKKKTSLQMKIFSIWWKIVTLMETNDSDQISDEDISLQ